MPETFHVAAIRMKT